MRLIHRSATKPSPAPEPGSDSGGKRGEIRFMLPRCPRTDYFRFVHRHGRVNISQNPEAQPEEADLVASAAAVVAGQLRSSDCRGSPA